MPSDVSDLLARLDAFVQGKDQSKNAAEAINSQFPFLFPTGKENVVQDGDCMHFRFNV